MHVYAEQILFENLIINYIILYATKGFTKSDTSKMRLFLAATIGSIYTLVAFIPSMVFMFKLISKIITAIILIQVAFKPKSLKVFIRTVATFHLIAFTFAGICLSLLYTAQIDSYMSEGIFYIYNFKIKKLVTAAVFGWILLQLVLEYIQNKNIRIQNLISFKIKLKDKEVKVDGMVDTGNSLRDPISRLPVIVVEFIAIKELFPESVQELFEKYSENNIDILTNVPCENSDDFKFRIIPYKALGKQDGMLLGFKADRVTFEIEDDLRNIDLVIGIYHKSLSNDDEYNALLHPDIIR